MKSTGVTDQREWFENRFQSEISWRDGTRDGVPAWHAQLLTDLILAIGDDEIRYFSAKYIPALGLLTGSLAVVAFTDKIVAYANFDGDPSMGAMPLEVMVTARRMLSSFSLESDGLSTGSISDPYGAVRITVNYPHFSRSLPLGESDWGNRESETADLITYLRRDVVA